MDPDHADALHLLGVLAYQVRESGACLGADRAGVAGFVTALPDAHHLNYGNARCVTPLHGQRKRVPAIAGLLHTKPDGGMAHNNLARVLIDQRALEAGLENARRAVELLPGLCWGFHANLMPARSWASGRFVEAEAALRRAVALGPDAVRELCISTSASHCRGKSGSTKQRPPTDARSSCSPTLRKPITISAA